MTDQQTGRQATPLEAGARSAHAAPRSAVVGR
jgi:hypothetical protein